jgi:hypothetical protein
MLNNQRVFVVFEVFITSTARITQTKKNALPWLVELDWREPSSVKIGWFNHPVMGIYNPSLSLCMYVCMNV